jgi:protoporphyrinogen oxidase
MTKKIAIIIGGGPAGLTAAYEFLHKTDIHPVVLEATSQLGGISQTINYKGNRMDIGGHRFFSKSDAVMNWWQHVLPLQDSVSPRIDPEKTDRVLLLRNRLSRIYFLGKFFKYPVSLDWESCTNLGFIRLVRIAFSYMAIRMFPIRQEKSLEDFFINRFGRELYATFFRDYTEKVWGVPCSKISPEWGGQRIKGLSIIKAVMHALKKQFSRSTSVAQKDTETSLIERFLYPKYGPGQMWEETARLIQDKGGEILMNFKVVSLKAQGDRIAEITARHNVTGEEKTFKPDHVISSMPVKDLIQSWQGNVPAEVKRVADGLVYRDFMTAGLLLKKLKIRNTTSTATGDGLVPDNWIYIQERDVKLGRLQIFNNWSPYLVKDRDTAWIGLEYFCNEGDALWSMQDTAFIDFAAAELEKIGVIDRRDLLDGVVVRMPKAYPAYLGTHGEFDVVRSFTDKISNLFLVGRNGMHRYNNQDHSMLTAMAAIENIRIGTDTKDNLWQVNAEDSSHESNRPAS